MGRFNPNEHLIKVQGGRNYLPVADRLIWFREDHPDWGISTSVILLDNEKGRAVFHAEIIDETGRLVSSGSKAETAKGFEDFIEKAETGAVGRALGMLGYGTQFTPEFDEGERLADAPRGPITASANFGLVNPAISRMESFPKIPNIAITKATMDRLHGIGAKAGIDHTGISNMAKSMYKIGSTSELTEGQAFEMAVEIRKILDAEKSLGDTPITVNENGEIISPTTTIKGKGVK